MTIPVKHEPVFIDRHVLSSFLRSTEGGMSNNAQSSQGSSFAAVMKGFLTEAEKQTDISQEQAPLSKEQIRELVSRLRERMDSQMLRMATGDESKDGSAALTFKSYLSDLMPPADQASKIRHLPPKSDAAPPDLDLKKIIERAADTYGVDRNLIHSVVRAESNYEIRSTSPKGAKGLMQLMPATAEELGVQNSYDPVQNIMAGTRYLKGLLDRYQGNTKLALAAYNWGMGNVEKHPDKLPKETSDYISRIFRYLNQAKV